MDTKMDRQTLLELEVGVVRYILGDKFDEHFSPKIDPLIQKSTFEKSLEGAVGRYLTHTRHERANDTEFIEQLKYDVLNRFLSAAREKYIDEFINRHINSPGKNTNYEPQFDSALFNLATSDLKSLIEDVNRNQARQRTYRPGGLLTNHVPLSGSLMGNLNWVLEQYKQLKQQPAEGKSVGGQSAEGTVAQQ